MSEACDNCLCWLKVCDAECCKQFRLIVNPRQHYKKGQQLIINDVDEDYKKYMALHNQEVFKDGVRITLDNFKKVGKYLFIYTRCSMLNAQNQCRLHNSPEQPKACKFPNKDGRRKDIYLTPNCLYKNVKVVEDE